MNNTPKPVSETEKKQLVKDFDKIVKFCNKRGISMSRLYRASIMVIAYMISKSANNRVDAGMYLEEVNKTIKDQLDDQLGKLS